jgi:hypothetical protein
MRISPGLPFLFFCVWSYEGGGESFIARANREPIHWDLPDLKWITNHSKPTEPTYYATEHMLVEEKAFRCARSKLSACAPNSFLDVIV